MPQYQIKLTVDANRITEVKAKVAAAFGEAAANQVSKVDPARSRADRLSEAQTAVEDAKTEVETLRDELQEWLDNLPENLQSGTKADEIQEAIDGLETLHDELDNVDFDSITFPGMY